MKDFWRGALRLASRRLALLEGVFVLLVVVAVWGPFLASTHVDDASMDWTFRTDYVGYELNALVHDHQFPFWVTDGRFEQLRAKGIHDFFANPETDVLSVITPLAELWGLLAAVKVALIGYLALGVWGCRRLLALLAGKADMLPLLLASLMVLCNGAFAAHILHGHTQFLAMATFPLALAFSFEAFDPALRAAKRSFRACLAGAVLAMDYYSGATHPLFYFLLCCVVLVPLFTVLLQPKRYRVVLPAAAIVGVSFLVLAAFKLLPGLVDFGDYRANYSLAYDGWSDFARNFVIPWVPVPGRQLQHETNIYVGWVGVGVLSMAVLGIRERWCRPLLLACLATAWMMFLKSDSHLLTLPLLRTQGVPTRLRFVLIMIVAIIAATQIQRLLAWERVSRRRWLRIGVSLVLLGMSGVLAFDLSRTNVLRHVAIGCLDAEPRSTGPYDLAPDLVPVDRRVATVKVDVVEANEFSYEFTMRSGSPALLRAPGLPMSPRPPHLRLVGDGELTTKDGALAVRVRAPHGHFVLRFYDPVMYWGLAISSVGLLGLIGFGVALARASGRRTSIAGA
jgi:hypothetical protein